MKQAIQRFIQDQEGATAIEYGIIAGAMATLLVAIFGSTGSLGTALTNAFTAIAGAL